MLNSAEEIIKYIGDAKKQTPNNSTVTLLSV